MTVASDGNASSLLFCNARAIIQPAKLLILGYIRSPICHRRPVIKFHCCYTQDFRPGTSRAELEDEQRRQRTRNSLSDNQGPLVLGREPRPDDGSFPKGAQSLGNFDHFYRKPRTIASFAVLQQPRLFHYVQTGSMLGAARQGETSGRIGLGFAGMQLQAEPSDAYSSYRRNRASEYHDFMQSRAAGINEPQAARG